MPKGRFPVEVAFVALVVAAPITTYWLVGDLSEPGDPYYLDYFVKSTVSESSVKAAGLLAFVVLCAASTFLVRTARPLRRHLHTFRAALMLVLAGEIVAVGARVATAGTSGANIGAGLFLIFGLPISVVLVVTAIKALTSPSTDSTADWSSPHDYADASDF
jgi:hypothetical protein